jgi:F-type H+-transporting ATPase subunit a
MSADTAQFILHHVQDGSEIQLPGGPSGFSHELFLKNTMHEGVMHPGLFGDGLYIGGIDVTPTKLTIMMWIASIALLTILLTSMKGRAGVPRGKLQNVVEALFLFVRDEIAVPNIGHEGHRYTPYLATCFFFILALNFLGLVPYGATATGNLGVTIVLASTAFVMTQIAGMRAQGVAGYWLHLVPAAVPKWLYPVMVPVELIGLITKPFALMMRLFANMVAGHLVLFFLIALIFFIGHVGVAVVAIPMAFAIFLLEIFVALLQAYVFTLLTSVFIGMTQHAH